MLVVRTQDLYDSKHHHTEVGFHIIYSRSFAPKQLIKKIKTQRLFKSSPVSTTIPINVAVANNEKLRIEEQSF